MGEARGSKPLGSKTFFLCYTLSMVLSGELLNLVLYAAQQLGIVLGVGAQTVVLIAYLSAMRDGVIDDWEERFARAVVQVLYAGLALVVLSGLSITATHLVAQEQSTLMAPAFLLKWGLIGLIIVSVFLPRLFVSQWIIHGFAGGTWFALFVLHILAPVASWETLLLLYGVWLAGFFLCWTGLVFTTRKKKKILPISTPVVTKPEPPQKPILVLPAVTTIEHSGLPAIRVMPKTPEEATKHT